MRRIVVSPVKRAEMRGDISGSDALPEFERTHGKIAWHRKPAVVSRCQERRAGRSA